MNTDGFIVNVKTDGIYRVIAEEIKIRFDTSNYEIERPLQKGENKKDIGSMKDELGRKMVK